MNSFVLRLKLLVTDRTSVICYLASSLIILAVLLGLNYRAEERSSMPVGLICEDSSDDAVNLCERLRNNEAIYVYEGDMEYLQSLLLDGYLNSIFIIEEGYGERLHRGDVSDIIRIYSAEDDKISAVVSDIFAGEMMYDICVYKAYNEYSSLKREPDTAEPVSLEGYEKYLEEMLATGEYSFGFDMHYYEGGSTMTSADITNGMLYRQMIAGMAAMLLMLIVFCACSQVAREGASEVMTRRRVLPGRHLISAVYEVLAVIVFALPVSAFAAVLLQLRNGALGIVRMFLINLVFVALFAVIYYFAALLLKNLSAYQILGAATVIFFGASGFISVFRGFLGETVLWYLPVSQYIDCFLKI